MHNVCRRKYRKVSTGPLTQKIEGIDRRERKSTETLAFNHQKTTDKATGQFVAHCHGFFTGEAGRLWK